MMCVEIEMILPNQSFCISSSIAYVPIRMPPRTWLSGMHLHSRVFPLPSDALYIDKHGYDREYNMNTTPTTLLRFPRFTDNPAFE